MYDFVFVLLVYRNTKDLSSFFSNFNIKNSKVIVVNSFYDEYTERVFREISYVNNADFFSVENKGYGYGNNKGCEYALKKYKFKYMVISNPDVAIRKWDYGILNNLELDVIAPRIRTSSRKDQNPHILHKHELLDFVKYVSFKHKIKILLLFAIGVTKIERLFFLCFRKKNYVKVYAPHGAFILLSYNVIKSICPAFNENMFLFCEEDHLARLLLKRNYNVYYTGSIEILHKVDGSVEYLDSDLNEIISKSYIEYYEYWHKI